MCAPLRIALWDLRRLKECLNHVTEFFDLFLRTRVVYGEASLDRLGDYARELGFTRTLIVSDKALLPTGFADRTASILTKAGIWSCSFHDFDPNPDSHMVEAGRVFAAAQNIDSIVAVGGGSSLDCAKAINFVLTNGGTMRDYWGFGKAHKPLLPSIGIPTTAGTGSEAQAYALISDPETHRKMACGDPKAAFKIALLDPELTLTQPRRVTAEAGFDAISHAVESFVTKKRTAMSDLFARDAWRLLEGSYERVLANPQDVKARGAMLLGAHEAGVAIELSMLGATHACANPLTSRYGTTHAVAISIMLPQVVRWNSEEVGERYAQLLAVAGKPDLQPGECLAKRLEQLAAAGGLPNTLSGINVPRSDLPILAENATKEWTGTFNPRPLDAAAALALYERAYSSPPKLSQ
jgi:alcohol dehydrogenase